MRIFGVGRGFGSKKLSRRWQDWKREIERLERLESKPEAASAVQVEMLEAAGVQGERHGSLRAGGQEELTGPGACLCVGGTEGKECEWQCKNFQMVLGAAERNNLK